MTKNTSAYTFTVSFLAANDNLAFDLNSPHKQYIEELVGDLLSIFSKVDIETGQITVVGLQRNTEETQGKITAFTNKYSATLPQLNSVSAFFRKLDIDQHFIFLPNIELEKFERMKLYDYLTALSEGKSFEEVHGKTKEIFEELFKIYEINIHGTVRKSVGEPNKIKRVCRFCNNKQIPLTFNSVAHAISEALGNKMVRLHDECDVCNEKFSRTIERDIIQYFSLFRTIYDVKGKGGSKQFVGKNFEMMNNGTVEIKIFTNKDETSNADIGKISLELNEAICFQNIYKCLCKYFLSVIEQDYLDSFSETVEWINGSIEASNLPLIAEMVSYHGFTKQPKIATYLRKNDDERMPYAIGEFYFTCKVLVFIIPFSSNDTKDFLNETDYKHFWEIIQHYKKSKGWSFNNYSSNNKKTLTLNLEMHQKVDES